MCSATQLRSRCSSPFPAHYALPCAHWQAPSCARPSRARTNSAPLMFAKPARNAGNPLATVLSRANQQGTWDQASGSNEKSSLPRLPGVGAAASGHPQHAGRPWNSTLSKNCMASGGLCARCSKQEAKRFEALFQSFKPQETRAVLLPLIRDCLTQSGRPPSQAPDELFGCTAL